MEDVVRLIYYWHIGHLVLKAKYVRASVSTDVKKRIGLAMLFFEEPMQDPCIKYHEILFESWSLGLKSRSHHWQVPQARDR